LPAKIPLEKKTVNRPVPIPDPPVKQTSSPNNLLAKVVRRGTNKTATFHKNFTNWDNPRNGKSFSARAPPHKKEEPSAQSRYKKPSPNANAVPLPLAPVHLPQCVSPSVFSRVWAVENEAFHQREPTAAHLYRLVLEAPDPSTPPTTPANPPPP